MKKTLLIMLIIPLIGCFAQNYVLVTDLTEKNEITYYKGEKFSGFEYAYQDNGLLQYVAEYKNGLLNGHYSWFQEDGNPLYVNQFKDGLHHGWCNMWYENGFLWVRGYYYKGKVEPGTLKCWNDSGAPMSCD